jgi:mannose-6-phosphate isomerase-like protein (cupin superfamily)
MRSAIVVIAGLLAGISAGAQSVQPAPASQNVAGKTTEAQPAPSPAIAPWDFLKSAGLQYRLQNLIPEAQAKGSSGDTLMNYGRYKVQLSVRTVSGGAEVHAHWDDVMMVEQGRATLITGGTVVEGKTDVEGETHGVKIEGGQSQPLAAGDLVTVRAGTPHQLMVEPGIVYGAVVIKVMEP